MKKIASLILMLVFVSCTKGAKSPDGLVKVFAKDVATKKLDMDYYEKFTTGEMWDQIQEMGEEDFSKNTRMVNVTDVKIKILSKTCESNKCVITYTAKYKTKNSEEGKFESEVKKIAEVQQDGEYWKMAKVTNLKTFHESNKPINPLTDDFPKKEIDDGVSEKSE